MWRIAYPFLFLSQLAFGKWDADNTVMVVISSNKSFDYSLSALKFADRDGIRFADIMRQVGQVDRKRTIIDPSVKLNAMPGIIERTNGQLTKIDADQKKFIFFFSGHADETGLHFSDGLLGKQQLHAYLSQVEAQTKIVFLDSCFAGALTKKGARRRPAYELPKAEYDEPSGSIFISASSSREYSYESDDLEGSVFTHHLISGLNGSADASGDGIVTVDEIYQYVYRETKLHSLLFPSDSSQTPEFVSRLQGKGAVAMSFPAMTNARVVLRSDVAGQITIASNQGIQMYKVDKMLGSKRAMQLPPGRYSVSVDQGHRVGKGDLDLRARRTASLSGMELSWLDRAKPQAKGRSLSASENMAAGVTIGQHRGYTGNQKAGPFIDAVVFGRPAVFGGQHIRGLGMLSFQKRASQELGDSADIDHVGFGFGGFYGQHTVTGMTFGLMFGAGTAWQRQRWTYTDREARTFESWMPTANFGTRIAFTPPGDRSQWGLSLRREFLFIRDTISGKRTLASNLFGVSLVY